MSAERKAGDFGALLREARERRGTSLRDIANATKISVAALEALERNDVSRLPGGIFSRAFVRSYAAQIGLNPEETVEEFLRQFPNDHVTVGHTSSPALGSDADETFESDRRTASTVLTLLAISVPLAAVVLYLGTTGRKPSLSRTNGLPVPPVAAAHAERVADTAGGIDAAAPLHVELTAVRECVISVAADGQPSFDVALPASARRSFDVRREMTLTVSDGGAIAWTLNGMPGRAPGTPGVPASLHLTVDTYREFVDLR